HAEVRQKYELVHRHDRAGRLVDAQKFEHLEFPAARFAPELLEELTTSTAETVRVRGDQVVIEQLYTERRVEPLDLYLARVGPEDARRAVLDYGQAVKDLAASNVFPGDMLLKNFGVTRHGRLVFYDYDELCLLTECRFRDLPSARSDDEETSGEPWFYVGANDVFPEEFQRFLGLEPELLDTFLAAHADLLDPAFWRGLQERLRSGEVIDVYPYRSSRRLRTSIP
ncbi:MAG: bifunctional isocitrate dehydrogenase kinase/phosphatase, partial [Planctomycetes bacterium]|nr:bifunctional isocitrate dehydrogenase kinase/phosphatase [Planctomycetota bacterium]